MPTFLSRGIASTERQQWVISHASEPRQRRNQAALQHIYKSASSAASPDRAPLLLLGLHRHLASPVSRLDSTAKSASIAADSASDIGAGSVATAGASAATAGSGVFSNRLRCSLRCCDFRRSKGFGRRRFRHRRRTGARRRGRHDHHRRRGPASGFPRAIESSPGGLRVSPRYRDHRHESLRVTCEARSTLSSRSVQGKVT